MQNHHGRRRGRDPRHEAYDALRIRFAIVLASAFAFAVLFTSPVKAANTRLSVPSPTPAPVSLISWGMLVSGACASLWSIRKLKDSPSNTNQRATAMFRNTRALIVDHRLPDRLQLRGLLESMHIEVAEEGNGSRGADRALNERFDVIFMSPGLPIMRAAAVRNILRRSGITTPVLMAGVEADDREATLDGGGFSISHPVELPALHDLLHRVIGHKATAAPPDHVAVDLAAMDEALASQDFDQLIALAQKLRDFGGELGSDGLTCSAERLEAYLVEADTQDARLAEIKATVAELGDLASSLKRDETEVRAVSKSVPK